MEEQTSQDTQTTPRPHIADLLRVAKSYRLVEGTTLENPTFSLVNEIPLVGQIKPGQPKAVILDHDFSRDELIKLIGLAYPEFASLVKEMTLDKANLAEAQRTCVKLYELVTRKKIASANPDWIQEVDSSVSQYRQCFDVLQNIAYNLTAEKAKPTARAFMEHFHYVSGIASLVNENTNETQNPSDRPEAAENSETVVDR